MLVQGSSEEALDRQFPETAGLYRAGALVTLAASVTVCASIVLLLAIRARPIHGDFCRAAYVYVLRQGAEYTQYNGTGIIPYTAHIYSHWSGRWAGVWLETILLSKTSLPSAYPWLVLILVVAQCLLLYFAVWELVANIRWALYFSAVIALVYWAAMPSPQQGIFWIPGAVESQLPLTVMSLLFALVLSRRSTATKQPTLPVKIAVAALGFLVPAFHELAGGILVLALSLVTATAFVSKSPLRKMWLIAWTAATAGFLVVFFAPGNAIRMAHTPNRGNYSTVIHEVLSAAQYYVLPWCLDFKHWLLAVLLWIDPHVASLRERVSGLSSFRAVGSFLLSWISLIMIAIGATVWNFGSHPPGRTMDLIYGMFLMGWVALAFLVMRPHPTVSIQPAHRSIVVAGSLFLLCSLVATSDNTERSIGDLIHGRAQTWEAELNHRYAVLKSAEQNADIVVPPISDFAKQSTLFWVDIGEDPNLWANRCLAKYYDLASVRISPSAK